MGKSNNAVRCGKSFIEIAYSWEWAEAKGVEVIFVSNSQRDMLGYQVGSSAQRLIKPLFIV